MGKFLRDIYFEQFVTEFPQMLSFEIILGKYVDEKSFEQTLTDEYNRYHHAEVLSPAGASEGAPPDPTAAPHFVASRRCISARGGVCVGRVGAVHLPCE